jgi:hypothetical protein
VKAAPAHEGPAYPVRPVRWTDDELTVVLRVLTAQTAVAGWRGHGVNARLARAFRRSPKDVEEAWEALRYHLWRLDTAGVAAPRLDAEVELHDLTARYKVDLSPLRRDAREASERRRWGLEGLLA